MNQSELANALNKIAEQNEKSHAEIKAATATLIDQVADLTAALDDIQISDDAVNALIAVQAAAQAIDDLNPDVAPAPAPAPGPAE